MCSAQKKDGMGDVAEMRVTMLRTKKKSKKRNNLTFFLARCTRQQHRRAYDAKNKIELKYIQRRKKKEEKKGEARARGVESLSLGRIKEGSSSSSR